MSDKSTRKPRSRKTNQPKKPYKDFPLGPHASGAWCKRIRGRLLYFGRWGKRVEGKLERLPGDGREEALALYKAQAGDLHAGRTPRLVPDGELTVADLCNGFLTAKLRLESGELAQQGFNDYKAATDRMVRLFGSKRLVDDLAADDFAGLRADLARQYGPTRLANEVQRVRTIFRFGTENGLITKVVLFGSEFRKPSQRVMRLHKQEHGRRPFEPGEIRKLLDAAHVQFRAMILLGVNCGYGNHDLATLPLSALNLEAGWATFGRPKTGIPRRCPLWAETVTAIREMLAARPSQSGLVFMTKLRRAWTTIVISHEMQHLLQATGVRRKGLSFYSLRHTLRTVADAAKDTNAIRIIMGHTDGGSIDGNYTHGIDDARLVAVANHVHAWLFDDSGEGGPGQAAAPGLRVYVG